jgi:deoxyribonuclease V
VVSFGKGGERAATLCRWDPCCRPAWVSLQLFGGSLPGLRMWPALAALPARVSPTGTIIELMVVAAGWPTTAEELVATQLALAQATPPLWEPPAVPTVAGCFACFSRGSSGPGQTGEPGWAAAALYRGRQCVVRAAIEGRAGAPYLPGLFALRTGALLENAVRSLPVRPDVLIVDATGHDHPRRAGLALHLGAVLDMPTIGVTHRTLLAVGDWPTGDRGALSPLLLDGVLVGFWVRTRDGRRPLAVHAGWRTDPGLAARTVLAAARHRTPTPLREARRLARTVRAGG